MEMNNNNFGLDIASARKEAKICNLIGRNGKVTFVSLDPKNPSVPACFIVDEFSGNFNTAMLRYATWIIKSAIQQGVGINCLTTDNNAVTYRYYRKVAKDCNHNPELITTAMTSSKYFVINDTDDEKMSTLKNESRMAVIDFTNAMIEADDLGLYVEFNKASEFNQLILNVPEDVEIEAGDILKFTNGSTENGITVNGWKNFSRENAKVYTKAENGATVYYLYKKSRLTPIEQAQRSALAQQWAKCPATEIKVDLDDVQETHGFDFGL